MATPGPAEAEVESGNDATVLGGQELRERALSGVLAVGLRSIAVRVMGLLANVVVARQLSPDDFGLAAFGLSIVSVGAFFTSGGIGAALIRQDEDPTTHQLQSVFGMQFAASLAVTAIGLAIGLPLGKAGALTAVMILSLPIDVLRVPSAIVSQRELRFGPIVRAEVGEMIVYNLIAVALVLLGVGVWSLAIASLFRAAVGSGLLIAGGSLGLMRPRLSWRTVRPLVRFGLALEGIQLVYLGREQGLNSSTFAIGGVATLGQWNFSLRLLQPLLLLFGAVGAVAFPAVAGLLRAGEDPRPILEKGIRLAFGLTGAGVVILAAATPAAVPSLFGEKWTPAVSVVPWSLMGILLSAPIAACSQAFLGAIGQAGVALRSTIYHSIAWLVVSLPLIPLVGATALGIGWVVAGLVDAVYLVRAMRQHITAHVVRNGAPAIFVVVAVAPIGWLIEAWLGANLYAAALAGLVAGASYVAILFVVQPDNVREMATVLRRFVRRDRRPL